MICHFFIELYFLYSLFFKLYNGIYVTDGSSIILENIGTKYKLFSTDMKWGAGSGNQLVTAITTDKNEDNLLWTIKVCGDKSYTGNKINCDDIVTLKHVKSNGYLIGSDHDSILSNNYELSVHENSEYGKFQVICRKKKNSTYWKVGENIFLKNVKYNGYLSTSKNYEFNQYNCHNCPILFHLEASILKYNYKKDNQEWIAKPGVIIAHFNDDTSENYGSDEL